MTEHFAYSLDEENYRGQETSVEECQIEAVGCHELDPGTKYWIGKCVEWMPSISADNVLEQLNCEAYDEVGEHADDWLMAVSKEDQQKLEDELNAVLNKWLIDTCNIPTFYRVVDVKEYTVPYSEDKSGDANE
jgi:hypothetical protein